MPVPAVPEALTRPSFNICRADVFDLLAVSRNAALLHQIARIVPLKGPQGLAKVVYRKFPQANAYRSDCTREVGEILPVQVDESYNLHIVNAVAQNAPGQPKGLEDSFDLRRLWLSTALRTTMEWAMSLGVNTIIMPQIACGRAGDDWNYVRQMLKEICNGYQIRWMICTLEGPPTKQWVPVRRDLS